MTEYTNMEVTSHRVVSTYLRMALLEHSFSEYLCLASLNSDICSVYIVGVLWINLLPF